MSFLAYFYTLCSNIHPQQRVEVARLRSYPHRFRIMLIVLRTSDAELASSMLFRTRVSLTHTLRWLTYNTR